MSTSKRVCVIGAGPSGIAAAKNLLDEHHEVVVYDYGNEVGGNWVFSDKPSHSSVFETTHIISSKTLSQYDDFPMPEDYPDYPSHQQLAAYFQAYAKRFNLYPHIEFHTLVVHCSRDSHGKWHVTTKKYENVKTEIFDALAVCNGHHWKPRYPEYPGEFTGKFIHSHDVKRFSDFADQRVLVIGGGNSACDVAVESCRVSQTTDISWRRGYWVIPKFIFGKPSDTIGGALINLLPAFVSRKLTSMLVRIIQGKNKRYGLPEPEHDFGFHHPTLNSELFYFIRHGKIKPRPDIKRLDGQTVHFTDGTSGEYDIIVACTGYWIDHPFFDKSFIDYSHGDVPLYLRMFHPEIPNLYFIGLFQPIGCIWPGSELQSKLMARELSEKWKRPDNLAELAQREVNHPDYKQIKTPRHTITVDYHAFRKRLLKALK
ncbi:MAG: NAD(P)-binding domain-containing protein [Cyclobacteriaceae bacterium]|nr:NAD(P)-binding domain-containing protein [Cyclobacteriaceae bacterium]UYN85988.1 MAG: NAD(P)-binding domain-containing protein [Cyclobacteriaceae bacterium]